MVHPGEHRVQGERVGHSAEQRGIGRHQGGLQRQDRRGLDDGPGRDHDRKPGYLGDFGLGTEADVVDDVPLDAGRTAVKPRDVHPRQVGAPDRDPVCEQCRGVAERDGSGRRTQHGASEREVALLGGVRRPHVAEAVRAVPHAVPRAASVSAGRSPCRRSRSRGLRCAGRRRPARRSVATGRPSGQDEVTYAGPVPVERDLWTTLVCGGPSRDQDAALLTQETASSHTASRV